MAFIESLNVDELPQLRIRLKQNDRDCSGSRLCHHCITSGRECTPNVLICVEINDLSTPEDHSGFPLRHQSQRELLRGKHNSQREWATYSYSLFDVLHGTFFPPLSGHGHRPASQS